MSAPLDTATAEQVYAWLGRALTSPDSDNGWALAELVNAASAGLGADVDAVRGGRAAWAKILDPTTCPEHLLPYLAQFVGVEYNSRLTTAQMRAKIKERPYHRRGTVEAIKNAARSWLLFGDIVLTERDGSAYAFTVSYSAAQVGGIATYAEAEAAYATYAEAEAQNKYYSSFSGDEDRLQAAVIEAKPVGLIVNFDKTA